VFETGDNSIFASRNLIMRFVIDGVVECVIKEHIELISTVGPGDEDDLTVLCVKREVLDVEGAVGLDEGGVHPHDVTVRLDYHVSHHVVVELRPSTVYTINIIDINCFTYIE